MRTFENKLSVALVVAFFAVLLSGIFPVESRAAEYPERPITLIVPYLAGGITDLSARVLAESMSRHLKQPVLVMNRPGAGGTIGGNIIATAVPDGYTLGFLPLGAAVPEAFKFDYESRYSSTDLAAIASVAGTTMTFAVKADSPLQSMKDVVELARKSGSLLIGTSGKFTLPAMIIMNIAAKEGVKIDDVPFASDANTLPALLGGHIAVGTISYASMRPSVEVGKIRVLAICDENRADFVPNAPTMLELGYEMPYVSALGLFGPKGLPEALVKKLSDLVATIAKDPQFIGRMREMSIPVAFKDSAAYQKAVFRDRDKLIAFFKRQGLLK